MDAKRLFSANAAGLLITYTVLLAEFEAELALRLDQRNRKRKT